MWLCGKQIGFVDALNTFFRVSIPMYFLYVVQPEDLQRCEEITRADPSTAPISLTFQKSSNKLDVRQQEKVKILRVQLCHKSLQGI